MPDKEKPEKITVGGVVWNTNNQSFDVSLTAQFGIATAGGDAGFTISTVLALGDGTRIGPVEAPIVRSDSGAGSGDVDLRPHSVPWDRRGGAFAGAVDVTATSQLLGPSGDAIGGASSSTSRGVIVEGER